MLVWCDLHVARNVLCRWGIFHGTERKRNASTGSECLHSYILATHHYKYNSTSTKQEIDQTPGPVLLARSSLACH